MYPPQQCVLIPKAYSEGISLRKDGPEIKKEFTSMCNLDAGRSFRTAATFVSKLVPKRFVTTLTVDDGLTYYEGIAFERRTVMRDFSERTSIFLPKEVTIRYCSSLLFDPDATTKSYVAGAELIPGKKVFVVVEESNCDGEGDAIQCNEINGEGDAIQCNEKTQTNGDIGRVHSASEKGQDSFSATKMSDGNIEHSTAHKDAFWALQW